MSLRHALLAILAVEPMTGYDLTKHFDRSAAYVWHAPHSQIYPELRKLEDAGLVTAESVARGDHGIKRTYSITDAGLTELIEWVEELDPPAPDRDAFQSESDLPRIRLVRQRPPPVRGPPRLPRGTAAALGGPRGHVSSSAPPR